jgi:hypothetical protein
MDKLMQMDDNAMKFYVDAYFKEVRTAMQDGSIEAIDPRMVPMFSPAGNENYEQLQPEVDTKSLYLKGPDGNWMENPNHPDVKARQERQGRAEGTKSYDGEKVYKDDMQFAMPRKKDVPSGDPRGESRSITQYMLDKGLLGDADITPRDTRPMYDRGMVIERMETPDMGAMSPVKPEHQDLPKVLSGEQYLQMKQRLQQEIKLKNLKPEEINNSISMLRGMTSDEEYMRAIEIERGDAIVGDTPIMSQYPQNHFYDEEDRSRISDYNARRDETFDSI